MSIESVMPSNHLILGHPLLLLPSVFPSIRFFSNESVLHIRWPRYWSFSFRFSPSNEYSGLISFRIDWLDLLAVQGTLKSLLQHHSSKASISWRSAFLTVQLSHPYMTTGKTIALTIWTFVDKVISLHPEISKIIHENQHHIPEGKAEIGITLKDLESERILVSISFIKFTSHEMTVDTVTQPVDGSQLNITPLTNQVLENMFLDGENSCEKQLLTSSIRKRVSQTLWCPAKIPFF